MEILLPNEIRQPAGYILKGTESLNYSFFCLLWELCFGEPFRLTKFVKFALCFLREVISTTIGQFRFLVWLFFLD